MKILITGNLGFVGSRLIQQLKATKQDYFLCLIDKKNGYDITNKEKMNYVFREFQPEIVIHLAAELSNKLIPNLKNNVYGTYVITKLCKKYNVKKLIFSSSAAVYGNNCSALETDYLHPINFYGMAKKYCEKIIKKSGVPYIILRFSNVYGRGGKGILSRLIENKSRTITSPLHYTRDFIHCSDTANAIIISFNSDIVNEIFNISTGKETTLGELDEIFDNVNVNIVKKKEIKFSALNNSKAKMLLKWKPNISLKKGVNDYFKL